MLLTAGAKELTWALRRLRRRRWQFLFSASLLAVGIGANLVVLAVGEAVTLRRLPYADPGRLVSLQSIAPNTGASDYIPPPCVSLWRNQRDLFSEFHAFDRGTPIFLLISGAPEYVETVSITPGLFEMLGRPPEWGRLLAEDDVSVEDQPALISYSLANRLFGDASLAIGRPIADERRRLRVVGVMPREFAFPTADAHIWTAMSLADRGIANVRVVARLASQQTRERASRAVAERAPVLYQSIETILPYRGERFEALRDSTRLVGLSASLALVDSRAVALMWLVRGAAGLLLALTAVNIAGTLFSDALGREADWRTRRLLGAGRLAQFAGPLAETAIVSGLGATGAFLLAEWSVASVNAAWPSALAKPLTLPSLLNLRSISITGAFFAFAWLTTALPIVMQLIRLPVAASTSWRSLLGAPSANRQRQALIGSQVALTFVLTVGAVALLSTYRNAILEDKGVDESLVLGVAINPGPVSESRRREIDQHLLEQMAVHPAVEGFSRVSALPPSTRGGYMGMLRISGREVERMHLATYGVDPEFFSTLGVRVLRGAGLHEASAPGEMVVDERFARRFWPGVDPIGQRFWVGREFTIVGIAAAVAFDREKADAGQAVYVGYHPIAAQTPSLQYLVRLYDAESAAEVTDAIRHSASRSIVRVVFLWERYASLHERVRLTALVSSTLAAIGGGMAVVGIFGLVVIVVQSRSRELALRLALGASVDQVRRLVWRATLLPAWSGIAVGLIATTLLEAGLASVITEAVAISARTYMLAVAAVVALSVLAAALPVRRIAAIDPTDALREG